MLSEYWIKRCKAAEKLIEVMIVPNMQSKPDDRYLKFLDINDQWNQSKITESSPPKSTESEVIRKAWEAGWNERNKACGLNKAGVLKRKFEQWNIYKQTIDI